MKVAIFTFSVRVTLLKNLTSIGTAAAFSFKILPLPLTHYVWWIFHNQGPHTALAARNVAEAVVSYPEDEMLIRH